MGRHLKTKSHLFHPSQLKLDSILEPVDPNDKLRLHSKVVFTLGPSCQSVEALSDLLMAGAHCARLDLTWGPLEFHMKSLENLQKAMRETRKLCAVMVDVRGRDIIVNRPYEIGANGWPVHNKKVPIQPGAKITITSNPDAQFSESVLPVNYSNFPGMCEAGDTIYIGRYLVSGADQASLYLKVLEVDGTEVKCEAENEAVLDGLLTVFHVERSESGISNVQNTQPLFSDSDIEALKALTGRFEIDFLALPFCRDVHDIMEARTELSKYGFSTTRIFAKVETRHSVLNFKQILQGCDGIMMSRGLLGLDCLPHKVALIQKNMVSACNMVGKPVIITRVVDTMVTAPRPTRAEATDIANAVLDGVDGILLGAETVRGVDPVNAVVTVASIARQAERVFDHEHHFEHLMSEALRVESSEFQFNLGLSPEALSPENSVVDCQDFEARATAAANTVSRVSRRTTAGMIAAGAPRINSLPSAASVGGLDASIAAMAHFSAAESDSIGGHSNYGGAGAAQNMVTRGVAPMLSRLESISSSAVKVADKINASLIIVLTTSGKTASLVAKYRPPMPILTLVVPQLVSDGMKWHLEGRHVARQCLLVRGLMPMLAAPSPDGERVMSEAIHRAAEQALIAPHDFVVVLQRVASSFVVKVLQVDASGWGISKTTTQPIS